ncbi:restriction endonuclease subunit S [Streptomyces sp. CACIS-1.16CA]|uniref:restriction endonuclease subunit S n=1 Tax=Streptomyces sp. CACIS-1.16CA TaxID=1175510 RepID=UPI0037D9721B
MSVEPDQGWSEYKLTDLVALPTGQVDPRKLPYREQPLLAPDHIESGTGQIIELRTSASQGASSGKYVVRPGDVVLSKIRPALRKVALAEFNGTCSADMYPLRSGPDVLPKFLQVELLSKRFSDFAESVSGRTGIPKINRAELASYMVRLPAISEQRRIVKIVDAFAELERSMEREIAKLRITRRSLIDERLAISNTHIAFSEYAVRIQSGWSPSCDQQAPGLDEWGVVRVSAVTQGVFRPEESKRLPPSLDPRENLEIIPGDLLMARANGARDLVGVTCLVGETREKLMLSDKTLRITPGPSCAGGDFLHVLLGATVVRSQIDALLSGSTGQANISQMAVMSLRVPRISISQQEDVVAIAGACNVSIRIKEEELAKIRRVKSAVTSQLLCE